MSYTVTRFDRVVPILAMLLLTCYASAQVSEEEARAKLDAKKVQHATTAATKPFDETVALRKAFAAAQSQVETLRKENVGLRADLKKALTPAAREAAWATTKIEVGMDRGAATKIYSVSNWDVKHRKSTDFIGKIPIDIELWDRNDIQDHLDDIQVSSIDSRFQAFPDPPKPGEPKTLILVNDIVIYVSPK